MEKFLYYIKSKSGLTGEYVVAENQTDALCKAWKVLYPANLTKEKLTIEYISTVIV